MTGKIIKGIAGFYYVHDGISAVYECNAKGIFRNKKIKPLVGDNVEFDILDEKERTGNIVDILERKKELIRPAVANIDQAMVLFAMADPEPNLNLLDRFLIMMEMQEVPESGLLQQVLSPLPSMGESGRAGQLALLLKLSLSL